MCHVSKCKSNTDNILDEFIKINYSDSLMKIWSHYNKHLIDLGFSITFRELQFFLYIYSLLNWKAQSSWQKELFNPTKNT